MDRIRINTDHVREVGQRLLSAGDHVSEISHELQRAMGSLDTWAWDGYSRRRAESLLARVRPESNRVAEGLDDLGRKLLRVADTFELEDATAAQNVEGMAWVEWGISVAEISSGPASFEFIDDNNEVVEYWENIKDVVDVFLEGGEVTFEQFKAWMNSIGVIDEYVIEVFYYQDDAVEILSVSEEWTRWIVRTPIVADTGWKAFANNFNKGLGLGSSKLPLVGLLVDMGLTTWEYSDEGLFSNPEYYAGLATDVILFVGSAIVLAGVASIGLVGVPAVVATIAASVGWVFVSNWLEEPLTKAITPAFEWAGEQLGSAWDSVQSLAADVGEWTSDALDWTENAINEAADWVSNQVGSLVGSLVPQWGW